MTVHTHSYVQSQKLAEAQTHTHRDTHATIYILGPAWLAVVLFFFLSEPSFGSIVQPPVVIPPWIYRSSRLTVPFHCTVYHLQLDVLLLSWGLFVLCPFFSPFLFIGILTWQTVACESECFNTAAIIREKAAWQPRIARSIVNKTSPLHKSRSLSKPTWRTHTHWQSKGCGGK